MRMVLMTSIFGWVATCLIAFSSIPQCIKVIGTHKTKDIALGMYVLGTLGGYFFVVYGVLMSVYISLSAGLPIAIGNFVFSIFETIVLVFKIRNVVSGVDKKDETNSAE